MAIGIALLFGIQLSDNFRGPYLSSNPREFWQRWHVSLSTWLRDQLYIPLGGSRGSAFATTRNLLVTMLLGGLWHGAAWTFVAWGAAHGVWLALHRALDRVLPRPGSRVTAALARVAGIVVTFHCVCATWILFRADDLSAAWIQFEALVVPGFGPDQWAKLRYVVQFAWLGVFIQGLQYHRPQVLRGGVARISLIVLGVYALSRILTDGAFSDARAFIYFQF